MLKDQKECVEEYYKDDESYDYCEEMYDMFKSEKGDVIVDVLVMVFVGVFVIVGVIDGVGVCV